MAFFNKPSPSRSSSQQERRSESTIGEECGSLAAYELDDVDLEGGKVLGRGSYGAVMELKFRGEYYCVIEAMHTLAIQSASLIPQRLGLCIF